MFNRVVDFADCNKINKFNFFIKQLRDFENVLGVNEVKNRINDIINQFENSIIAENPNMSPSLKNRLLNSNNTTAPIANPQTIGTMDDPNRSYIPSSAPFKPKNSEPMRTYVPSSAPANLNGELSQEEKDNVQRALQKADWAEAEALKLLG